MTDTMQQPAAKTEGLEPGPPPRRAGLAVTLAVVAVVAVLALAVVTVVAVTRSPARRTTPMMDGPMVSMMNGSMGSMMNGSMMNGSMGSMMGHGSSSPTIAGGREVAVSASSFRFQPSELHVRTGEAVNVVLAASDTAHDFTIDELGVHVAASPGTPGRGGFRAPSSPGRYTAYCSVPGHRQAGMVATVVVEQG